MSQHDELRHSTQEKLRGETCSNVNTMQAPVLDTKGTCSKSNGERWLEGSREHLLGSQQDGTGMAALPSGALGCSEGLRRHLKRSVQRQEGKHHGRAGRMAGKTVPAGSKTGGMREIGQKLQDGEEARATHPHPARENLGLNLSLGLTSYA
jgi:hypothetical protein